MGKVVTQIIKKIYYCCSCCSAAGTCIDGFTSHAGPNDTLAFGAAAANNEHNDHDDNGDDDSDDDDYDDGGVGSVMAHRQSSFNLFNKRS